jgi:hypothetical protein
MEFPYRVALEEFLEAGLRAQEQPVVKVTIADDGETATVQMADKCTQYRLSPKAHRSRGVLGGRRAVFTAN